jgi:poly(3-hydroxybutyrate) depolymerase
MTPLSRGYPTVASATFTKVRTETAAANSSGETFSVTSRLSALAGHGQAHWTYSVPTAEKDWAAQDDCSSKAVTSRPSIGVTRTDYSHRANDCEVQLYEVAGEGHEWPDGPVLPSSLTSELGPQSSAIDANAVMWSFFKAHPLAG